MSHQNRLSRTCYDKAHRCPGWVGGGLRWPKGESRCDNGHIHVRPRGPAEAYMQFKGWFDDHPGTYPWRFGYCDTCNVKTWPVVTRWLDPTWLWCWLGLTYRDLRYRYRDWRDWRL